MGLRDQAAAPDDEHAVWLCGPYLGAEAAFVVGRGLTARPPLLLQGEAGTGKRHIARAVHARSGTTLFLPLAGPDVSRAAIERAAANRQGTLFVDLTRPLTPAGADDLADLLDAGGSIPTGPGSRLRVIVATERDLAGLADSGLFPRTLYHRLSVLPVRLAPLRERREEIPLLATQMLGVIARTLGRPAPRLSAPAIERLADQAWAGNLAELESVLTRTLVLRDAADLGADDLAFDHTPLLPPATRPAPALAVAPRRQAPALEMIVQELAHEFRNPLVTLKTFAQLAGRAAEDGGGDGAFARQAAEAADRMDAVLENLVQYAGLSEPRPRSARLADLFAAGAAAWTLAAEGDGAGLVRADPEQISFALANLIRALAGEPRRDGGLTVRYEAPSTATIRVSAANGAAALRLGALLGGDEAAEPLGVAIARAIVERNGGTLAVRKQGQILVAELILPAGEEG